MGESTLCTGNVTEADCTVPDDSKSSSRLKHETLASKSWRQFRRHPGAIAGTIVLGLIVLAVILAPLLPYDPEVSDLEARAQPPSLKHPMGTDHIGRDMMTRVLYGGRISLAIGVLAVGISLLIGTTVGAIAGFYGGFIDNLLMRTTDFFRSFPSLFVLILLSALLRETSLQLMQNSVMMIVVVIGILSWMLVARVVRACFLSLRETDFVMAARAVGAGGGRIIARHLLPNALGPIIVEATLEVGYAILTESGLSFLGFGVQPPTATWGNMLANAQERMVKYPWMALFPGLMICLTTISINYIGDGLRDAFDPRKTFGEKAA
jgi:peptide/nickel transport system permease protein